MGRDGVDRSWGPALPSPVFQVWICSAPPVLAHSHLTSPSGLGLFPLSPAASGLVPLPPTPALCPQASPPHPSLPAVGRAVIVPPSPPCRLLLGPGGSVAAAACSSPSWWAGMESFIRPCPCFSFGWGRGPLPPPASGAVVGELPPCLPPPFLPLCQLLLGPGGSASPRIWYCPHFSSLLLLEGNRVEEPRLALPPPRSEQSSLPLCCHGSAPLRHLPSNVCGAL